MTHTAVDTRLSGEDLTFWWADSPMQPTTMAMLLVLDRVPEWGHLCHAVERATLAVPRLRQRVEDAPFDLTLPRWVDDPTFDVEYHVRRHALGGTHDLDELFHEIAPAYETPFDRSRPLWEARLYEGLAGGRAAIFFKLHHAVADGVGANAIFAAMTDWDAEGDGVDGAAAAHPAKGTWGHPAGIARRVAEALRDRIQLDVERLAGAVRAVAETIRHPGRVPEALGALRSMTDVLRFDSHSPLKKRDAFGRARRLAGVDLPFEGVRRIRHALGGTMIDVILTIMARAIGRWHGEHGFDVRELMTLVPVNLRKPEEWTERAAVGNVATGLLVPLPVRLHHPLATFWEVRRRITAAKADPAFAATPLVAEVLSVFGRRLVSWMGEATFGAVDFIVTNVPGILAARWLAGAEIVAAYPFAPVALKSPASVAIYGYRDRLFVGIDADEAVMPDVDAFRDRILEAFDELAAIGHATGAAAAARAVETAA
jgi:diacylglycerol O-acyltransferase / wax synthase